MQRKKTKPVKPSKTITQELKAIEHPNIVAIKSVTIEHPKTYPRLKMSQTIRQTEKVSQVPSARISNSSLYDETRKIEKILNKKC